MSDGGGGQQPPRCRRLEGKVAVVTASTAGIGLGIVRRLAAEGARVVVSSRKAAAVEETVRQLRSEGLEVRGVPCHVGDAQQIAALVRFAAEAYGGGIDILVSNAAVNPASGPILSLADAAIDKILDINGRAALGGSASSCVDLHRMQSTPALH